MKKLLLLTLASIALCSCGQSVPLSAEQLTKSNAIRIEDNSTYSVFVQKVDSVEYLIVWSRSNGDIAITKR